MFCLYKSNAAHVVYVESLFDITDELITVTCWYAMGILSVVCEVGT